MCNVSLSTSIGGSGWAGMVCDFRIIWMTVMIDMKCASVNNLEKNGFGEDD